MLLKNSCRSLNSATRFFFLTFFLLTALFSSEEKALHFQEERPTWVTDIPFSLKNIPPKSSQINQQYILIDFQQNVEQKTFYHHYAVKPLTKVGTERASQIKIDFDPSYTQVAIHGIRIFRNGEWLDRLATSRNSLIQREQDLERNLYDGNQTLVYFLEDLREGDLLEYSFSSKGEHPLFSSHHSDRIFFQDDFSIEKMTYRLVASPDFSFTLKSFNFPIEPQIKILSPTLKEWYWEARETPPYTYEDDQPSWYNPPAHIEITQYKNWNDVAKKVYEFYQLPENLAHSIPSELKTLVKKWKDATNDPREQALLALRFVQDDIRYLGLENGLGAFKPTDPSLTFLRRFGDCKDKTFLLHALLHLMNISSKPILVNAYHGKRLPERLPSPFAFNHLVLQIEIERNTYYVDPTMSLQGGSLNTVDFPDYHWGLPISPNTQELTPLPHPTLANPTEIDSFISLESEDSALVELKVAFHGPAADSFRRSLAWYGLEDFTKDSLSSLQKEYGTVAVEKPVELYDNRKDNKINVSTIYRVPTQKHPEKITLNLFSYTINKYLPRRINPERTSPKNLSFPLWVKERIHINNPFTNWTSFEDKIQKNHESFFFNFFEKSRGNFTQFDFELKHLQDHIPVSSLRDYWNAINEIENSSPTSIRIAMTQPQTPEKPTLKTTSLPYPFSAILAIGLWIFLFFRSKNQFSNLFRFKAHLIRIIHLFITCIFFTVFDSAPFLCFLNLAMIPLVFFLSKNLTKQLSIPFLTLLFVFHFVLLNSFLFTNEFSIADQSLYLIASLLYFGSGFVFLSKIQNTELFYYQTIISKSSKRTGSLSNYTHKCTMEVNLPLQKAWDLCSNPTHWTHWNDLFEHFKGEPKAGSTILAKIKNRPATLPLQITDFVPLERFSVTHNSLHLSHTTSWRVQALSPEKTLILSESLFFGKFSAAVSKGTLLESLEVTLAQMLRFLTELSAEPEEKIACSMKSENAEICCKEF